jgi:ribonuclease E
MANIDPEAEAAADAAAEAAARALDRESEAADTAPPEPTTAIGDLVGAPESVAEVAQAPRQRDDQRFEEGGRRRRRRRRGGKFDSERGEDRIAGAASPAEGGGRGERPSHGGETRHRPEFQRRALPTPAEFEVGGAGMFGRPNLDDSAIGEGLEASGGEAQPGSEQTFTGRPGDDQDGGRKRRRRGRRGGRRRRRDQPEGAAPAEGMWGEPRVASAYESETPVSRVVPPAALDAEQPVVPTWPRRWPVEEASQPTVAELRPSDPPPAEPRSYEPRPYPPRAVEQQPSTPPVEVAAPEPEPAPRPEPKPEPVLKGDLLGEPTAPRRTGWWRRG